MQKFSPVYDHSNADTSISSAHEEFSSNPADPVYHEGDEFHDPHPHDPELQDEMLFGRDVSMIGELIEPAHTEKEVDTTRFAQSSLQHNAAPRQVEEHVENIEGDHQYNQDEFTFAQLTTTNESSNSPPSVHDSSGRAPETTIATIQGKTDEEVIKSHDFARNLTILDSSPVAIQTHDAMNRNDMHVAQEKKNSDSGLMHRVPMETGVPDVLSEVLTHEEKNPEKATSLAAPSSVVLIVDLREAPKSLGLNVSSSMVVDKLQPGGFAELAGVKPGDKVVSVGECSVTCLTDVYRELERCHDRGDTHSVINLVGRREKAEQKRLEEPYKGIWKKKGWVIEVSLHRSDFQNGCEAPVSWKVIQVPAWRKDEIKKFVGRTGTEYMKGSWVGCTYQAVGVRVDAEFLRASPEKTVYTFDSDGSCLVKQAVDGYSYVLRKQLSPVNISIDIRRPQYSLGMNVTPSGVVDRLQPGGQAELSGVKIGYRLAAVEEVPVSSLTEVHKELERCHLRGDHHCTITLRGETKSDEKPYKGMWKFNGWVIEVSLYQSDLTDNVEGPVRWTVMKIPASSSKKFKRFCGKTGTEYMKGTWSSRDIYTARGVRVDSEFLYAGGKTIYAFDSANGFCTVTQVSDGFQYKLTNRGQFDGAISNPNEPVEETTADFQRVVRDCVNLPFFDEQNFDEINMAEFNCMRITECTDLVSDMIPQPPAQPNKNPQYFCCRSI